MTKENLRIVYMGTPDFAVESLRVLVENDYNIVGVVTMPDKPAGRGYKVQYSPVKKYALEKNIPLLQPEKLKDQGFLNALKGWKADLQIVVAFRMLPEAVWNMPPMGTFNLHGSLLPQYRGAAPINWAIMNGEKETGVTTFFLKHEIDTGEIILQDKVQIKGNDNVGNIHDELMQIGAELVKKTVDLVIEDKVVSRAQNEFFDSESELKDAPKIFRETGKIDWSKNIHQIHNHIRGLSPYPCAWTELHTNDDEKPSTIKVYESEVVEQQHKLKNGTIHTDDKTYLHVACIDGFISIKQMQMPGKRAMNIIDVLNGYKFDDEKIRFK